MKIAPQRGEGEKREECKFQNKAHRTFAFDIINSSTPVYASMGQRQKQHHSKCLLGYSAKAEYAYHTVPAARRFLEDF